MKSAYVHLMHTLRRHAESSGVLSALERRKDQRWALWLRSLLAIYDVEDLIRLEQPWWTFASARLVERFLALHPGAKVFEYGAGASTLWLAQRAAQVQFVEHDPDWIQTFQPHLAGFSQIEGQLITSQPSATPQCPSGRKGYVNLDFQEYVAAIAATPDRYEVIVIDGRARVACLHQALSQLNTPGLIVFDNAGRRRYQAALRQIIQPTVHTWGLTPCLPYPESTLLIFSDHVTRQQVAGK
ncbi:MAG: class I SAM-dependent methyltransferase [Candidatus Competibacteraceae bacterium]|nr:class I SAM-dependent methyltransferase [Candidatus Competibacteraceae bacterium]